MPLFVSTASEYNWPRLGVSANLTPLKPPFSAPLLSSLTLLFLPRELLMRLCLTPRVSVSVRSANYFATSTKILSWEPLVHHKKLCKSAKEGCQLCQAFVRGQGQQHEVLEDEFDKDKGFPATQLTWSPNSCSGPHILRQDALFVYPHREVVNLWVDLYTTHGNIQIFIPEKIEHQGEADFMHLRRPLSQHN